MQDHLLFLEYFYAESNTYTSPLCNILKAVKKMPSCPLEGVTIGGGHIFIVVLVVLFSKSWILPCTGHYLVWCFLCCELGREGDKSKRQPITAAAFYLKRQCAKLLSYFPEVKTRYNLQKKKNKCSHDAPTRIFVTLQKPKAISSKPRLSCFCFYLKKNCVIVL